MEDNTLTELAAFQDKMNQMPAERAALIAAAREAGHTWTEIAATLGMTHPGAMKAAKALPPRQRA